jgi:hypothetical protein
MKGTLFSADFIKDKNGNLRLLELNTDTGIIFQEIDNIDYTDFFNVLQTNGIDTIDIIYKPYIHFELINSLTKKIKDELSFIININLHDEEFDNVLPTSIEDAPNKFILRVCFDDSALFDNYYTKNRLNVYNLFNENELSDFTVAYFHSSDIGETNTLTYEINDENIPDATIKDINESFNPIDFFKIGALNETETNEERWNNFLEENKADDKIIEQYHFHPSNLDELGHITSVRYYGIVYGPNLDLIDLHSYRVSSIFEMSETLDYETTESVYSKKIMDHHYYELTTNFLKKDSGGILSGHEILKDDGTWIKISDITIGESVTSYSIEGSPQTESNLNTVTWNTEGSTLPTGSYKTTSEVVFKDVKQLKYCGMVELKVDNDSVFSGVNKKYLIYDSLTNLTSFKYLTSINADTDYLFDIDLNLIDIDEANFFVTKDPGLTFIELDVEEADTYIIKGSTSFNSAISHNAPCFVAGTQIQLENNEIKNIEDVLIGDIILSYDFKTESIKPSEVLNIFTKKVNSIVQYTFNNDTILKATLDHPIYVIEKGWASHSETLSNSLYKLDTPVKKIEIGDNVKLYDKIVTLTDIKVLIEPYQVYNLSEINPFHNYFANDVLVHNRLCFIAGTMIAIPDNFEKPIEEIKVGDIVLSFNENKKMVEEKIVTEINSPIHDDLVEYKFSNNSTIVCTFDHPLYVNGLNLSSYKPNLTNSRYNLSQNVTQINVGDVVNLLDNNTTTILEINELETIKTQTYIFSVDGNRNFFANGILVHNK